MSEYNGDLGMHIRNTWMLHDNTSPLTSVFTTLGVLHADDMSNILLASVWRRVHDKPLDIAAQVTTYKDFWAAYNSRAIKSVTLDTNKMKHFISCGYLIQSQDKFLLCHPSDLRTGKAAGDTGWGLPKGKVDPGETQLECALRETREETNLDLLKLQTKSPLYIGKKPIYDTTYPTHFQNERITKTAYIFHAWDPSGVLQAQPLSCPTLVENTNIPEMDDFRWVTAAQAVKMSTNSIRPLFENIDKYV